MNKEWNAVEILRHSRHDWLNKLQLIKGNLALNRFDRVHEIIEEIIMETKNDTKLTNLKASQLAGQLMVFNWRNYNFLIDYEIVGEERDLSEYDNELSRWCRDFFHTLNEAVKPYAENNLSISIQTSNEEVRFFFDFSGIIKDENSVLHFLKSHSDGNYPSLNIVDYEVHNDAMIVTLQI
ncbi:Spo0B C-terminal domain-containing protein [Calidifontibacillus oryziterrae]|uniref:Spo0B C-terminal domain-containing protein n=1 Tax=Calidifontibacillus oryziterrae TaxID=1191699 RepID=UPI000305E1CE|nr:Spo0B C-terminal domain-containing protein [Calidifontibacillus oryziterrae]